MRETLQRKLAKSQKPKVTAAIDKNMNQSFET
jgi:hypothetical protein